MLTISITFAILVALWGFSGTLIAFAKRGLAHARQDLRFLRRPPAVRAAPARTRGTRPVASA